MQAPAALLTNGRQMHGAMPGAAADSGRMTRDMEQIGRPMKGTDHDSMPPAPGDRARARPGMDHGEADMAYAPMAAQMAEVMDLHRRMMPDPVIRQRVMADTVMRCLVTESMDSMMPGHLDHRPPANPPAPRRPLKAPEPANSAPHHHQHSSGPAGERGRAT